MEDKEQMVSSRYALEFVGTRLDKTNFRLVVALILTILSLLLSNLAWLYAWMQYDYSSTETTYTQDGQGTNIIGNSNEVQHYVPDFEGEDENPEEEKEE